MAHKTAAPTHNHPEGFKGAEATALAIFHLKNGKDKEFIRTNILDHYYPDWSNKKYAEFHDSYTFYSTCAGTVGPAIICFLESEDYVHIYREESSTCSAYRPLWVTMKSSVNIGDTLTITIGSKFPEANVLCEIYSHDEKVCSEWVPLRSNTHTITYPVTSDDLGGVSVLLLSVNHNNMEIVSRTVSVTDDKKDIRFEFLRFRDKTQPGSLEEYQVRLTDKEGKPVSAELLCSMYDMALDAIGSSNNHSMSFFSPLNRARGEFGSLSWGRSLSQNNYRSIYLDYSVGMFYNWLNFRPNACTRYYGYGKVMSVRGNRSDGAQTIVDGVRVRGYDNGIDLETGEETRRQDERKDEEDY